MWFVAIITRLFGFVGWTATTGWPLTLPGSFVTLTSRIARDGLLEAVEFDERAKGKAPAKSIVVRLNKRV
jgi:hypothetical protein